MYDMKEFAEAVAAFRKTQDELLAQTKQFGSGLGDTQAKLDSLNERLNSIEGGLNRKTRDVAAPTDPGTYSTERKNFITALRNNWSPAEAQAKGLSLGVETAGGFLSPTDFVQEMLTAVVEISPIRQYARNLRTSLQNVAFPKRTQTATATWVSELGTRAETQNPAFGLEQIPTHEMHAMTKVSRQLIEDSAFDLDAFLREEFSEQFGLTEGTAFISGNAVGKPEGLLTNSSVNYSANGHATELKADGVLGIQFDLKAPYWANARYFMNRSTLKAVRLLKDSQNQYLWQPGLNGITQPNIAGFAYTLCEDLPSVGSGTYPILFGDMRKAYLVADRINMEVLVDPFTSKSTGQIEFSARRRVGGQVILAEAIRSLKMATS